MDLEKQVDHIATVVDLMSKDQGEFKARMEKGMTDIAADVRALKDGRLRDFDLHTVKTETRLATLESEKISKDSFKRIEKIVYGACGAILLEAIAIYLKH